MDAHFILPEFYKNRDIKWTMHVDESKAGSCRYDMIMGRDLMTDLGIKFDFENFTMTWDNASIPIHDVNKFNDKNIKIYENEIYFSHDPSTTDAERI